MSSGIHPRSSRDPNPRDAQASQNPQQRERKKRPAQPASSGLLAMVTRFCALSAAATGVGARSLLQDTFAPPPLGGALPPPVSAGSPPPGPALTPSPVAVPPPPASMPPPAPVAVQQPPLPVAMQQQPPPVAMQQPPPPVAMQQPPPPVAGPPQRPPVAGQQPPPQPPVAGPPQPSPVAAQPPPPPSPAAVPLAAPPPTERPRASSPGLAPPPAPVSVPPPAPAPFDKPPQPPAPAPLPTRIVPTAGTPARAPVWAPKTAPSLAPVSRFDTFTQLPEAGMSAQDFVKTLPTTPLADPLSHGYSVVPALPAQSEVADADLLPATGLSETAAIDDIVAEQIALLDSDALPDGVELIDTSLAAPSQAPGAWSNPPALAPQNAPGAVSAPSASTGRRLMGLFDRPPKKPNLQVVVQGANPATPRFMVDHALPAANYTLLDISGGLSASEVRQSGVQDSWMLATVSSFLERGGQVAIRDISGGAFTRFEGEFHARGRKVFVRTDAAVPYLGKGPWPANTVERYGRGIAWPLIYSKMYAMLGEKFTEIMPPQAFGGGWDTLNQAGSPMLAVGPVTGRAPMRYTFQSTPASLNNEGGLFVKNFVADYAQLKAVLFNPGVSVVNTYTSREAITGLSTYDSTHMSALVGGQYELLDLTNQFYGVRNRANAETFVVPYRHSMSIFAASNEGYFDVRVNNPWGSNMIMDSAGNLANVGPRTLKMRTLYELYLAFNSIVYA